MSDENNEDWRYWYRLSDMDRNEDRIALKDISQPVFSRDDYLAWRLPRYGTDNPTLITSPVWEWQIQNRLEAYVANDYFEGPSSFAFEPAWSADRFGQAVLDLPDGRLMLIAGEHEDHYDPDFYIYNDVIILHPDKKIEIYIYPREIFPPTDFHSATLVGDEIFMIGNLGYMKDRDFSKTQVMRLNIHTMQMKQLVTHGEKPGWIRNHHATLADDKNSIRIHGGKVMNQQGDLIENIDEWSLHLPTHTWTRLTHKTWHRWLFKRSDNKQLHLFYYQQLQWNEQYKLDNNQDLVKLTEYLGAEPDREAFQHLYSQPIEHTILERQEDEYGVIRICIQDVTVRFNENAYDISLTIEGSLPTDLMQELVNHTHAMLERIEQCAITLSCL